MAPANPRETLYSRYLVGLSIALYAVCLFLDAFCVELMPNNAGRCDPWPGYPILLSGWILLPDSLDSWANLTWLANPLLLASWLTIWLAKQMQRTIPILLSVVTLATGAAFVPMKTVITNAGGVAHPIVSIEIGYWLWLVSMATACLAALILKRRSVDRTDGDAAAGRRAA
jgi:hypothetical protein